MKRSRGTTRREIVAAAGTAGLSLLSGAPWTSAGAATEAADAWEVHVWTRELKPGDRLVDGPGAAAREIPHREPCVLIWVNLEPTARFAHPTLYLLVTRVSAEAVPGQWWPVLNGKQLFRNKGTRVETTVPPGPSRDCGEALRT